NSERTPWVSSVEASSMTTISTSSRGGSRKVARLRLNVGAELRAAMTTENRGSMCRSGFTGRGREIGHRSGYLKYSFTLATILSISDSRRKGEIGRERMLFSTFSETGKSPSWYPRWEKQGVRWIKGV